MNERQGHRRAAIAAAVVAALVVAGSAVSGIAVAGPDHASGSDNLITPTIGPSTTIVDPTTDPTTTDPTTEPTTTDPTTDPTTTLPTTTTEPPTCQDPGPRAGEEGPASDEPAVPPDGGSSVSDAILDVATEIMDLWRANQYSGFSGMVAAPEEATLRLYWLAGEALPPEIEAIVADPGQPITVAREDAPYSRSHLEPLAERLLNSTESLSDQMCGFLHTIKVLEEGTGLIAGVAPYDATFDVGQAEQLLSSAAGVPVSVEVSEQPMELTRLNDAPPWFAGARITSPGRGQCSAGFGIVRGGHDHMLTALHCFPMGAQVRNGNGTRILGPVVAGLPAVDSEIISVDPAGTSTYFGGVNGVGAAEYTLPVTRPAANIPRLAACTSGASTGENCKLVVVRGVVWWRGRAIINGRRVIATRLISGMVEARSTVIRRNGQLAVAAGQGDSGGPVVTDSGRERYALGIISAGDPWWQVHCGLFADPPGTPRPKQCSARIFYADIGVVLWLYGARMKN